MTGQKAEPRISAEDRELIDRAVAWVEYPNLQDCASLGLQEVTRKHGLDFATALLYDRVLRRADNQAFFRQAQTDGVGDAVQRTVVGIVPGAFYRDHKDTGADGAGLVVPVESLNCPVERVPVESFGSLARNASLIADWLSMHQRERVAFISLSKGSADLKVALGLPHAAELFGNVVTWISLSGLPQGTPLVAWLRRQPLRRLGVRLLLWLRGQRYSVVEELRHEADGPLRRWPALPPRLRVIHVVAFPLRRHLAHPWASRGYERVAPLGPNDGGGFLLSEVTNLPGTIFPVWGADHYLQPAWDVTASLRRVLVTAMSSPTDLRQANQSEAQPIKPPANKSIA